MKILCPTDLSKTALNAMEYASKLAQKLSATLTLVNVQKISIGEGVSMFSGAERESVKQARSTSAILEDYCNDINKTFEISCSHLIIPTMDSIENSIADEGSKFDLIVVGTNGTDGLFQFYFGSHSYHIARKVKTPVLIVPEECMFQTFGKICFATDYVSSDGISFKEIYKYLKKFNAHFDIVHLSDTDSELSKTVFHSFCNSMEEELGILDDLSFKRMISKDPIGGIKHLVDSGNVDLLIVAFQNHSAVYKLFHKNLIKEIAACSTIPLLTVNSQVI